MSENIIMWLFVQQKSESELHASILTRTLKSLKPAALFSSPPSFISSSITLSKMPQEKVTYADVVIIGAGPAGLIAAAWASAYNIRARVLDDKAGRTVNGHADGLTCRTLEILDSFGIVQPILNHACFDYEMCSWVRVDAPTSQVITF
jgi:hypothetical protein